MILDIVNNRSQMCLMQPQIAVVIREDIRNLDIVIHIAVVDLFYL